MARPALVLACMFALASMTLHAQGHIYTWTDAQGVVHYSQIAPEKGTAQVRDIKHPSAKASLPEARTQAQPKANDKTDDELSCERATLNLDRLNKQAPLAIDRKGDGKTEPMTTDDRAAAKALAQRQIDIFCAKK